MTTANPKYPGRSANIVELVRNNWTWTASILYIYVTGIGMGLSWAQFKAFRINVFEFAELNDFLLAAFREPFALLGIVFVFSWSFFGLWFSQTRIAYRLSKASFRILSYVGLPLTLFIDIRKLRRYWIANYRRQLKTSRNFDRFIRLPVVFISAALLAPSLAIYVYYALGKNIALQDLDRRGDVILKSQTDGFDESELFGVVLIGTTDRFAFFYNDRKGSVLVVPVSNILLAKLPAP